MKFQQPLKVRCPLPGKFARDIRVSFSCIFCRNYRDVAVPTRFVLVAGRRSSGHAVSMLADGLISPESDQKFAGCRSCRRKNGRTESSEVAVFFLFFFQIRYLSWVLTILSQTCTLARPDRFRFQRSTTPEDFCNL